MYHLRELLLRFIRFIFVVGDVYVKKTCLFTLVVVLISLLSACEVSGYDPLEGTSWELIAYRKTKPIPGTTITATFEGGRVSGSAGCNAYSAEYQIKGERISVGVIEMTAEGCIEPEGVLEQEDMYIAFLKNAQIYEFSEGGDQLEIIRSDWEALTFIRQD
jgi:heat shock protein HslJ